MTHAVEGQQISASGLPEFARDVIKEEFTFVQGVPDLEIMIRNQSEAGTVDLLLPMSAELVQVMNSQTADFQAITALYFRVSIASIEGIVERILTDLTSLIAELGASSGGATPSKEEADYAVGVTLGNITDSTVTISSAANNS